MAIASVAGMIGLVFFFGILALPFALLVVLQVWLCKKGRRLGLILPALSLLVSLALPLNLAAFSRGGGGNTLTVYDEAGNIVEQRAEPEEPQAVPVRALAAAGVLFLVGNIPTLVFGGIWLAQKNRDDLRADLEKMSIQDLE